MNQALVGAHNPEMKLRSRWTQKDYVTGSDPVSNIDKPCFVNAGHERFEAQVAQAIRGWRLDRPTDRVQRNQDDAGAIDARLDAPAMKAKPATDQIFRRLCQIPTGRRHDKPVGYRSTASLPGRNGSPWKLTELANRASQVLMV